MFQKLGLAIWLLTCVGLARAADVQISQLVDNTDPAIRGADITYRVSVLNGDNDTATNVKLEFPIPANTSFASVNDGRCSHAANLVTCNLGSMTGDGLGGPITDIDFTITTGVLTGSTVNVSATITADGDTDTTAVNSNNNYEDQNTTMDDGADLSLAISDSPDPAIAGGTLTYTLTASNAGPNDAGAAFNSTGVTLVNTLPGGVTFTSASGTGWSCGNSGQTVTCNRELITSGASAPDITLVTQITGQIAGTITDAATVSSITADPVSSNNTQTQDTSINQGTDLTLSKSVAAPVVGGSTTSFTLQPRNLGPYDADNLVVTDTLPSGFTYISAGGSGWSCAEAAQTVTCSRASYSVGATDDISIQTNVPASGTNITNSASISTTTSEQDTSNNSDSVTFSVVPDGADLSLNKSKTPDPVALGSDMTSVLTVSNAGPQATSGTLTVTDVLAAGETYKSYTGSNWTCNHAGGSPGGTVTCTYSANLAADATASTLRIVTTATTAGALGNTASVTDAGGQADGNSSNDSAGASVTATTSIADLAISKVVSDNNLSAAENSTTYTLVITNNGPDNITDPGPGSQAVYIQDDLPGYVSSVTGASPDTTGVTVAASVTSIGGAAFSCSGTSSVRCSLDDGETFNSGDSVTISIGVDRPMANGSFTNTATVSSEVLGDDDSSNNSDSANIDITPLADVEMLSPSIPVNPAKAGTEATIVLQFRNNGPSTADNVNLVHTFSPPAGRTYTLVSATPSEGSCGALAGNVLTCNGITLDRDENQSIILIVQPGWDGANTAWTLAGNTVISTTTDEQDNGINNMAANLDVSLAETDLLINNTDVTDPVGWSATPGAFPATLDNIIVYQVDVSNRGPSLATGLQFTYDMTPKAGKSVTFLCDSTSDTSCSAGTSLCDNTGVSVTGGSSLSLSCNVPDNSGNALNDRELEANTTTSRYLFFSADSAPDSTGDTHNTVATVSSNEDDTLPGNDSEAESTSVRVKVDLAVTKTASSSTVNINEPFEFNILVSSNGPGDSAQSTLLDTLPAGMELTATPVTAQGSCSGSAGSTSFSCDLGTINKDDSVAVTVPVRITSYLAGNITNTAEVESFGVDIDGSNDSDSDTVTMVKSSVAGTVFNDLNDDGLQDLASGESGIESVTITLTGTDDYGNAVSLTETNAGSSDYLFDNLSPGSYTLTQTQPGGFDDGLENAGGTIIGNSRSSDTITVTLASNSQLTDHDFAELGQASLAGSVWHDSDNDGIRDAGETLGISDVTLTLTGTDSTGAAVNLTTSSDNDGNYSFANLRPGTYAIGETQPSTWGDGLDSVGSAGGNLANDNLSNIVLGAGIGGTDYNFGEQGSSLSGTVYRDGNDNGIIDAGEAGIADVTITLTGTDDLGNNISETRQTDSDGNYSFHPLPASDGAGYLIKETQPANIFDGKDTLGSLGGVLADDQFTLVLGANVTGSGYNFGEGANFKSSLSGRVYIDADADGLYGNNETGIADVELTLSGTSNSGIGVILTTTTGSNGQYSFNNLVASNDQGYSISQKQPRLYLDGQESRSGRVIDGSRGTDKITAIVLRDNQNKTGYDFGELQDAGISGYVYLDSNRNGIKDNGETGIDKVTLTLTGEDIYGVDVELHTTTNSNGMYQFTGLLPSDASGYTIAETQPQHYSDGLESHEGQVLADSDQSDTITGLVLAADASISPLNFGEIHNASLAGQVFADTDNNGLKSAQEPGIPEVGLVLSGLDLWGNQIRQETTTDENGNYRFSHLPPSGDNGYRLSESQPQHYIDGLESIADQVIAGSNTGDSIGNIPLAADQALSGYRFAELYAGEINGEVFIDTDDNGLRRKGALGSGEIGESGIPGVGITLSGTDHLGNSVNLTTITDENGYYSFENLAPSDDNGYRLTENQPEGYSDSLESINGALVDGSQFSDVIGLPPLAPGQIQPQNNFAELSGLTLSGLVWVDDNDNGEIDSDEHLRIAGVEITVTGNSDSGAAISHTVTTDENGYYQSPLLPPGSYSLTQAQPQAWLDGRESLGSLGGTAGNDEFTAIQLNADNNGEDYNFGERGSSLAGYVYSDINDNAFNDSFEAGIADVSITLSGTDLDGYPVSRRVTTGRDGSYMFTSLPLPSAQGYTVSEQQPEGTIDGRDSLGNLGGQLANDEMSRIVFNQHPNAALDYNFGEQLENPATISGMVWLDGNHNRQEDDNNGQALWLVDLLEHRQDPDNYTDTILIASTVTASDGSYRFDGLPPGIYEVQFRHPQGGMLYGTPVSTAPGADTSKGTIRNLVLGEGEQVIEQNLPVDPSGIVYDSQTREPVEGATVRISGPAGFNADRDLVGGSANVEQITGSDGLYQFLLFSTAPTGIYTLEVTEPAGYLPGLARSIPACTNTLVVGASSLPALVHEQHQPPGLGAPLHDANTCPGSSDQLDSNNNSTQFYLSFMLDTQLPSANVVNNHIPLDPYSEQLIAISKSAGKQNVSRGDLLPYQILVTNNSGFTLNELELADQLPPGFKYVAGSAKIDGIGDEPESDGRILSWDEFALEPGQRRVIDLITVIGAGVGEGKYVNQAWVNEAALGQRISNIATAAVNVIPDPVMDCSDLTGKVFDDANINGYQDENEAGLPGVRLATARGLLITTDQYGRYHIACAAIPNEMRGSNFIIKVDERTLPSGYRITTENPRVVRLTRGKLAKANFGASIHRVIRIEVNNKTFSGKNLNPAYQKQLEQSVKLLAVEPSVLRLAYQHQGESEQEINERLDLLEQALKQVWKQCDCRYPLTIERETFLRQVPVLEGVKAQTEKPAAAGGQGHE
ncbi:DUF11 domain-containing protein [Thalassomonas viridans]|uniref:DUF11 domain-containing protein n=1 Tax=Thalassomonas viridans TaxID=137584 RepID=A0AAE9Z2R6_9GAMM|nr:SdrD B-like domain-containing protein [Thalassomonas viridans]WDE05182.1 DUF11 domain-containing protein [Thalassomonas viridans]